MAVTMLTCSFYTVGFAENQDNQLTVYKGKLVCELKEHTHGPECRERASASDAKKEEFICGLQEHIHDADCYVIGESITENPQPENETSKENDTAKENGAKQESSEKVPEKETAETGTTEVKTTAAETEPADEVTPLSADMETIGKSVQVTSFDELKAEVKNANNLGQKDEFYQIDLQNDITWNENITISNAAVRLNLNGYQINMDTTNAITIETDGNKLVIDGSGSGESGKINLLTVGNGTDYIIDVQKENSPNACGGELTLNNLEIIPESNDAEHNYSPLIQTYGECTLNNVTIPHYRIELNRSLIFVRNYAQANVSSSLTINGGTYEGIDEYRRGDGGAINANVDDINTALQESDKIDVTINHGTFRGNIASNGAVAYIGTGTKLVIHGGEFSGCTADYGALAIFGGEADIYEGKFVDNSSNYGGAIYTEAPLNIYGGIFTVNEGCEHGGAIYSTTPDLYINEATFTQNSTWNNGGAIYTEKGFRVEHTNFEKNYVQPYYLEQNYGCGGAIYSAGELFISGGTLRENHAWKGGAIYSKGNLIIDNGANFQENSANNSGGAINAEETLEVFGGTFSGNTSAKSGGAIRVASDAVFKPEKPITFNKNTSLLGSCIYSFSDAPVTIHNAVITNNTGNYSAISCMQVLMENGRCPAIFDNITKNENPVLGMTTEIYSEMYGGSINGAMLGGGSANWYMFDTLNESSLIGPIDKEYGQVEVPNTIWLASKPSEQDKLNAYAVSPCVQFTENSGQETIYAKNLIFYTDTEETDPTKPEESESSSEEETSSESPSEPSSEESSSNESSSDDNNPENPSSTEPSPEESTSEESSSADSSTEETRPEETKPTEPMPDIVYADSFEELKAAVARANSIGQKDQYFPIAIQSDIAWDENITVSSAAVRLDLRGHQLNMLTSDALTIKSGGNKFVIDGSGTISVEALTGQSGCIIDVQKDNTPDARGGEFTLNDVDIITKNFYTEEYPSLIQTYGTCTFNHVTAYAYHLKARDGHIFTVRNHPEAKHPSSLTISNSEFKYTNAHEEGAVINAVAGSGSNGQINITLNKVTMQNVNARNGAVYLSGNTDLVVHGGNYSKNEGTRGGSFTILGGKAAFYDGEFTENRAEEGSAIYTKAPLTINGGSYDKNIAYVTGGAIYSTQYLHIKDAVFTDNFLYDFDIYKNGRGGAIYSSGELHISGGRLENNNSWYGGAVCIETTPANKDIPVDFTRNTIFANNTAKISGGAIHSNTDFTVNEATFTDNLAGATDQLIEETENDYGDGGAIGTRGTITVLGGTFTGNTAVHRGGAVYAENGTILNPKKQITISENSAESGGAVYSQLTGTQSKNTFYDTVITENSGPSFSVFASSLQMNNGRSPAIFGNIDTRDADDPYKNMEIYSDGYADICGTMLGEGNANWYISNTSGNTSGPINKTSAPVHMDGAVYGYSRPSAQDKANALAVSPSVLITKNQATKGASAIEAAQPVFITNEHKPNIGSEEPVSPPSTTGSTGTRRRNSRSEDLTTAAANTGSAQNIQITSPSYTGTGSWQSNSTGTAWKLQKPDGSYAVSEWANIDGSWYLFGEDGYTCSGWQKVNNEWYYFQPNAAMQTEWILLDDKWYYLDASQGAMKKGWIQLDGVWYYLGPDGALLTNGITPDGYYVDENGIWKGL